MQTATRIVQAAATGLLLCVCAGCNLIHDPATRLDASVEAGVQRLGNADGSRYTVSYQPDLKQGDTYSVQFDKVGALIVWYKNENGTIIDSGSTSHYSSNVDTPRSYLIDKPAGSPLIIELERQHGRAVIVNVK